MQYGYARVSHKDQNEDRQIKALLEVGAERIYTDKQSGKDFNRPQYKKLIRKLRSGDVIYVKSIDRLGRNYEEILEQWRYITNKKKADIVVLDMPLLDTRRDKDLLGTFVSDLVLQILSYVSQTEREFIKQRQKEGIAIAKAKGVRFGRPPREKPKGFYEYVDANKAGMSATQCARELGIAPSTFRYWRDRSEADDVGTVEYVRQGQSRTGDRPH